MRYEIWHNPRCSKSRATLEILEAAGVELRVRRYLEEAPTVAEIAAVLTALGVEPEAITRVREVRGGLPSRENREAWMALLAASPHLIERPVVLRDDGRAVVGRPPERVHEIL